jgi:hypothetical protein
MTDQDTILSSLLIEATSVMTRYRHTQHCKQEGDRLWEQLRQLQEQYCLWTDQNEYDLASDNITLPARLTKYTRSDLNKLGRQVVIWQGWVERAMTQ